MVYIPTFPTIAVGALLAQANAPMDKPQLRVRPKRLAD